MIGKNWKKEGMVLKLKLSTNSKRIEVANIIKENLEVLGIETKILLNSNNYDLQLKGQVVSLKPELNEYFNIDKNTVPIKKEEYEKYYLDPSFIGLYFDSIIIVHSKNLKGNFFGNWYNPLYNIDSWHKVL